MAHLFIPKDGKLLPFPLTGDAYDLGDLTLLTREPSVETDGVLPGVVLMRTGFAWIVMATRRKALLLNGCPVITGLAVLADRDEILLRGSAPIFFSEEDQAVVEPFPAMERAFFCGRCRDPMDTGLAVRCPRCKVWFHEKPERKCWTYAGKCAFCEQSTELDAGFSWTPEG